MLQTLCFGWGLLAMGIIIGVNAWFRPDPFRAFLKSRLKESGGDSLDEARINRDLLIARVFSVIGVLVGTATLLGAAR